MPALYNSNMIKEEGYYLGSILPSVITQAQISSNHTQLDFHPINASIANSSISTSVSTGGLTFNLIWDAAAQAAPDSFRSAITQAASLISSAITDHITANIVIDYSYTGGGAGAIDSLGYGNGYLADYSYVKSQLTSHASSSDNIFNYLPTNLSAGGKVFVNTTQAKLWGVLDPGYNSLDGYATFNTDISSNALVGVALHELTHAIGRVP